MAKPRVSASLSNEVSLYLEGAIEAGLYTNTGDGIRSTLRKFFEENPQIALKSVISGYENGRIDLITAARLANQSPGEFRERLLARDILKPEDA